MNAERLRPLDALRGLAALYVVVYHDTLRYPRFMEGLPMDGGSFIPGLSSEEAGVIPVLWFFLISGFVITWTVDRSRGPLDFVVGRASRIYPAYWASIAVIVALVALCPLPGARLTVPQVLVNATMLQTYVGFADAAGVYWSLAVELMFYLHVLLLLATGLWRFVHVIAFAWAVAGLAAAVHLGLGGRLPWRLNQLLLLEFGPLLAAGMMLYRLWRMQRPAWSAATLAVCALAVASLYRPVPAATVLVVAGLIAGAAQGGLGWLAARPLLWLGTISYALYLSHEAASFTVIRALDAAGVPHALGIAAGVGVALALASAITYGVERPAMRAMRGAWRRIRPEPGRAADGGPPGRPARPG